MARGELDGVFFGMLSISNPDLAKRLERGKEVNVSLDMVNLYGHGESLEELNKGYNDYPVAVY